MLSVAFRLLPAAIVRVVSLVPAVKERKDSDEQESLIKFSREEGGDILERSNEGSHILKIDGKLPQEELLEQ
jgi:hypothetical protein